MIPIMRGFPNGKFRVAEIERPAEVEAIARRFLHGGGVYVCEMLDDGRVNMSAVMRRRGRIEEVECAASLNGPDLLRAIDDLVQRSAAHIEP